LLSNSPLLCAPLNQMRNACRSFSRIRTFAFENGTIAKNRKIVASFKNNKLLSPSGKLCVSSSHHFHTSSQNRSNSGYERKLKLMDIPAIIWPHPMKSMRNLGLSFLIKGYFDNEFDSRTFLATAEQAIIAVSKMISTGDFNSLDGLLTTQAIWEIRRNYDQLNAAQKEIIAIKQEDIFYKFIYEIGMIFDDETNRRFVEIMVVLHGVQDRKTNMHNRGKSALPAYICNYRFRREFTKGVEDDWTINQANHRLYKDLKNKPQIFQIK